MSKTFAQAIYEGAVAAAETEAGHRELTGHSKEQFLSTVKGITEALDGLPHDTSLHVVLLGVTFVRNVILVAMRDNQSVLETRTGGSA